MVMNFPSKTTVAAALAATFLASAGTAALADNLNPSDRTNPARGGASGGQHGTWDSDSAVQQRTNSGVNSGTYGGSGSSMGSSSSTTGSATTGSTTTGSSTTGSTYDNSTSGSSMGATSPSATDTTSGMSTKSSPKHMGKSSMRNRDQRDSSMSSGSTGSSDRYSSRRSSRDPNGDRAVTALNTLMAAGYDNYSNFRQEGDSYVADATRDGQSFRVRIDPDTRSVQQISG